MNSALNWLAARSALRGLNLVVPIVFTFVLSALLDALSSPIQLRIEEPLFSVVLLACCSAGGALWGHGIARVSGSPRGRFALAGVLSYGPATVVAAHALLTLEGAASRTLSGVPVHVLFAILFVVATFVVAGLGGLALRSSCLAGQLALASGSAAALAFLAATIAQDLAGRRVGGPGAAQTLTMLSVMAVGNLAVALAGSAAIGLLLARRRMAGQTGATPQIA